MSAAVHLNSASFGNIDACGTGWAVFLTDLFLKDSERDVETSRLLASIVESSDDAIVSKDLNGIITSWNKAAERIFGYSAEEAIGNPITILAPPDRINDMATILDQIKQGHRVEHYETVRRRKDGELLNISLTVSPIRDAQGRIVGASKIARDITERKLAAETLAAQAEQLARSNADLQQFAYVTAHDLQEPLRGISSMSELLQQRYGGQLDQGAHELIAHVVASADRMRNLIGDILKYSQTLNAGEIALGPVATKPAVQWAVNNLKHAIEESAAVVEIGELPEVRGEMVNLVVLFQNLIGNAIKYRSANSPRITISAAAEDHKWVFAVADNGIGIDPAYREKIFGLFKRLHGAQYRGTGIGLALCRKIVENHSGSIWVESELGKGATFKFTLPMVVS
jgi:PAS domain S-box-containing protein